MAGYYRKFCNNFSVIAEPLTNLLSKRMRFKWISDCQNGFDKLKKKKKKKKGKRKVQGVPQSHTAALLTKRKRKPTNPNKHKSNKRTKSTKISSLFPKRGNHNAKRTEKHKNKMTQGKT